MEEDDETLFTLSTSVLSFSGKLDGAGTTSWGQWRLNRLWAKQGALAQSAAAL